MLSSIQPIRTLLIMEIIFHLAGTINSDPAFVELDQDYQGKLKWEKISSPFRVVVSIFPDLQIPGKRES